MDKSTCYETQTIYEASTHLAKGNQQVLKRLFFLRDKCVFKTIYC